MFQIGDKVVYGIQGVCCVAGQEERVIDRKKQVYLVLEPVNRDGSKYMVPTHNAAAMAKLRPMLTQEELDTMIQSAMETGGSWIPDEGQRKNRYRELIGSGDREKLMGMVRALYLHRASQKAAGKKCHLCDENFLRDAETLLSGEIAAVKGIDQIQARAYINETLGAGV